jgi:hypothetical protein
MAVLLEETECHLVTDPLTERLLHITVIGAKEMIAGV